MGTAEVEQYAIHSFGSPANKVARRPKSGKWCDSCPTGRHLPTGHVLAIIDFRDLAELAYIAEAQSQIFNLLEENNFDCMGYIETASLFTWSRHFNFNDATRSLVGNLCD